MNKIQLKHVAEALSKSQYVNQKIATSIPFKAPNGVVTLWFNSNGTCVGLDYYKEVFENEQQSESKVDSQ